MNIKTAAKKSQHLIWKFIPPAGHKPKSYFIRNLMKRIQTIVEDIEGTLINLMLLKDKKRRPERIDAINRVLQVMAYFTNYRTLTLGVPQKGRAGTTKLLRYQTIARYTQMPLRRVMRAVDDLMLAEYLQSERRFERYKHNDTVVFKGLPSIKRLTNLFYEHIGITKHALNKMKEYAQKKYDEIIATEPGLKLGIITMVNRIRDKVMHSRPPSIKQFTEKISAKIISAYTKKFA